MKYRTLDVPRHLLGRVIDGRAHEHGGQRVLRREAYKSATKGVTIRAGYMIRFHYPTSGEEIVFCIQQCQAGLRGAGHTCRELIAWQTK